MKHYARTLQDIEELKAVHWKRWLMPPITIVMINDKKILFFPHYPFSIAGTN